MVVGAYGTEDGVGVLVAGDGTEVEVELKEAGECSVTLVKFSKHAELLGIAFSDGTVKVVDVGGGATGGEYSTVEFRPHAAFGRGFEGGAVGGFEFLADDSIVVASAGGELSGWRISLSDDEVPTLTVEIDWREVETFVGSAEIFAVEGGLDGIVFCVGGRAIGGGGRNFFSFWRDREQVDMWVPNGPVSAAGECVVKWSGEDGSTLVCVSVGNALSDSFLSSYNVAERKCIEEAMDLKCQVSCLATSKDFIVLGRKDGTVGIVSVSGGAEAEAEAGVEECNLNLASTGEGVECIGVSDGGERWWASCPSGLFMMNL